ncbi:hypothetical protein [Kitasatospora sp. GAS204B]|uniref:hypothetical protein n=1 Tax=unclassified Kitasatospora TaxID=2633591 RepID=UPI00247397C9|nr:hypothetical protein [Kitasatospora sp. GAS204B]MDH6119841.1 hypothetical protein [Kitasatospora sp. GAS204B]
MPAARVLLPVGQDFGPLYGADGQAEPPYIIRIGSRFIHLPEAAYTAWRIASFTDPGPGEKSVTTKFQQDLAAAEIGGAQQILATLRREEAIQIIDPSGGNAIDFAATRRCCLTMRGLGNTAGDPEAFLLGTPGRPLLTVTATLYAVLMHAAMETNLWANCCAVADRGDTYGRDSGALVPEDILSHVLRSLPLLVRMGAVYLDATSST